MTSDGNNFNDFPENQLTIDFDYLQAYLREPYCITVLPCPDIIGGGRSPEIFEGTAILRLPLRLHHWSGAT